MPSNSRTVATAPRAILVIEDDLASRELLVAVIEQLGYLVRGTESAEEARAVLAQALPNLIVTDVELPGEDGLSFARRLREDAATAPIPVLAVTGHVSEERRAVAMAAGCADLLAKPLDLTVFADRLSKLLGTEPAD